MQASLRKVHPHRFVQAPWQDPYLREIEIDPKKYTPPDVARDLVTEFKEMKMSVEQIKKSRLR